jgi:hypothetical protein
MEPVNIKLKVTVQRKKPVVKNYGLFILVVVAGFEPATSAL